MKDLTGKATTEYAGDLFNYFEGKYGYEFKPYSGGSGTSDYCMDIGKKDEIYVSLPYETRTYTWASVNYNGETYELESVGEVVQCITSIITVDEIVGTFKKALIEGLEE